jgi:dynein light chain LC8-type
MVSAAPDNNGLGSAASEKDSASITGNVPKAIIKNVDMSEEMQQTAVDIALEAVSKFTVEKDIAAHLKKTMDSKFGPTWHAVVGQKFGSYVTHGEFVSYRYIFTAVELTSYLLNRNKALHLLLCVFCC